MSERSVVAYPPHRPRFVTPQGCSVSAALVRTKSLRGKLLWKISSLPLARDVLWTAPPQEVAAAWAKGIEILGGALASDVVGVLGEPGPGRKLTIVANESTWVVKVPLDRVAAEQLEKEARNYQRAEGLNQLKTSVPSYRMVGDSLLTARIAGEHPRWDSERALSWIREALTLPDGRAIAHGDVTPWNVIDQGGRFFLIDWERARFDGTTEPIFNLLDFMLRGATMAKAPTRVVRRRLLSILPFEQRQHVLMSYLDYRRWVSNEYADNFSTQAQRTLRMALKGEV